MNRIDYPVRTKNRLRQTLIAAACSAALFSPVLPANAASERFVGDWRTTEGATVRIGPCGEMICGQIIDFTPPPGETVASTRDENNRDASKRNRKILGLAILYRMRPTGDQLEGRAYDPRRGISANATVSVSGPNQITVKGCVRLGFRICESETWSRTR